MSIVSKYRKIVKIVNKISYIKKTFLDILLLYKNFFHWNISKILIFLWSIILGFLFISPLVLIFFIYWFFSKVSLLMLIEWMFNWILLNNLFWNIILVIIVLVYAIIYHYWNILLLNVSNSYIDWKKISYKENDYFKFYKIIKFFGLTIINFFILLVPIIFTIILMVILFLVSMVIFFLVSGDIMKIYEMVSISPFNYFTILSFIFIVFGLIFSVYVLFRTIFSYLIYLDYSKESEKVKLLNCIKKSFSKTKGVKKFLKFLSLVLILIVMIFPIKIIWSIFENDLKNIKDYSIHLSKSDEDRKKVIESQYYYYEQLWLKFGWYDNETLQKIAIRNQIYVILFSIFSFLFLKWLFLMLLSSFYKRELI